MAEERSVGVETVMGAASIVISVTLIHVLAVCSVKSLISGMALAVRSTHGIDAQVLALQGLISTLVHVPARLPVRVQLHTLRTEAKDLRHMIYY